LAVPFEQAHPFTRDYDKLIIVAFISRNGILVAINDEVFVLFIATCNKILNKFLKGDRIWLRMIHGR
jgi:hypothetical protein